MSAKRYDSNAARQQAYRDRLVAQRPAPATPTTKDPDAWEAYLIEAGLSMSRGKRGLVTGGTEEIKNRLNRWLSASRN